MNFYASNALGEGSAKVLPIERKTPVLCSPSFPCLKNNPTINITQGCLHSCIYCYAKGFGVNLPKGHVLLYTNLVSKLEEELRRKRRAPELVSFSTASDPFQPFQEILNVSYQVMELLLQNQVCISILTKGYIPDPFITLFRRFRSKVKVRIGIVSASDYYQRMFEPNSASIAYRFSNIERLRDAGIEPQVRVDPVIPNFTDSDLEIHSLFSRLKNLGIRDLSVSCLVIRPYLYKEFLKISPDIRGKVLQMYFKSPYQRIITSAKTKLLPRSYREQIYDRFKKIGVEYGMAVKICGCKNPDLPWEYCVPWGVADKKKRLIRMPVTELLGNLVNHRPMAH